MFAFLKNLFSPKNNSESISSLLTNGPMLVDVRNPDELKTGQVSGAINIPLSQVTNNLDKFKNQKHIILYCRSGNRASLAKSILKSNGITNVTNGGSWKDVDKAVKGSE